MDKEKPSLESDERLLLQLLLKSSTRKRLKLTQKVSAFLSHGSWQGIGGILGLFSLVVSVILTVYIFEVTNKQQNATIRIYRTAFMENYGKVKMRGYTIGNQGPAIAEGVVVTMTFHKVYLVAMLIQL